MIDAITRFCAEVDPVLVVRTGAIFFSLAIGGAVTALIARMDREPIRRDDPLAEPFGDVPHIVPLFRSAGVALRTDATGGRPSVPSGPAADRTHGGEHG